MAKDKEFEKEYKRIGLERSTTRVARRKDVYKNKLFAKENGTCPYCRGEMTWCDSCGMWTSYCCSEYGTCQCS